MIVKMTVKLSAVRYVDNFVSLHALLLAMIPVEIPVAQNLAPMKFVLINVLILAQKNVNLLVGKTVENLHAQQGLV